MNNICEMVGEKIRFFRKARGYTLNSFAEQIHKSRSVLSKYERGEISIDLITLQEICSALKVPLHALLEDYSESGKSLFFEPSDFIDPHESRPYEFYMYTYFSHASKPVLRVHKLAYNKNSAVLYIYPTHLMTGSFEYYYSGRVIIGSSFTRFMLSNPLVPDDVFLLEIPTRFQSTGPSNGFFCALSIGPFFPVAGHALISDTIIEDKDWLISTLSFNKISLKENKKLNCFFVHPGADHFLQQELAMHKQRTSIDL